MSVCLQFNELVVVVECRSRKDREKSNRREHACTDPTAAPSLRESPPSDDATFMNALTCETVVL